MKRELTKDDKIQLGAKVFCAVLCISVVGGTFGYMKAEEVKAQKEIAYQIENNWGREETTETKNEVLESLLAEPLSDNEKAHIDRYVIEETTKALENTFENAEKENTATLIIDNSQNVASQKVADTENTGFDKNGHPYLLNGHNYTFGADGFPIEAPTQKASQENNYNTIINPNTGVIYTYSSISKQWLVNHQAEEGERARQNRDGIKRFDGTTQDLLVEISDEDIKQIAKQMKP